MPNMKIIPNDPFIMNCKIISNDLGQIHQRVMRMWAAAENSEDFTLLDELQDKLENILFRLKNRLDT